MKNPPCLLLGRGLRGQLAQHPAGAWHAINGGCRQPQAGPSPTQQGLENKDPLEKCVSRRAAGQVFALGLRQPHNLIIRGKEARRHPSGPVRPPFLRHDLPSAVLAPFVSLSSCAQARVSRCEHQLQKVLLALAGDLSAAQPDRSPSKLGPTLRPLVISASRDRARALKAPPPPTLPWDPPLGRESRQLPLQLPRGGIGGSKRLNDLPQVQCTPKKWQNWDQNPGAGIPGATAHQRFTLPPEVLIPAECGTEET